MPADPLFYYITDRTAFAPDEPSRRKCLLDKIAEAARAGVDYIQLREKDLTTRELESLAIEAVAILQRVRTEDPTVGAKLLINSRTDVALTAGTDGVHLRSDDVSPREVRALWQVHAGTTGFSTQPTIGVSCHSPEEVGRAEANGASFAVFAPIFGKKDAPGTRTAGLAQLREACRMNISVLALGGITLENAQACFEVGAAGVAAIRLFQENEVTKVVDSLRKFRE